MHSHRIHTVQSAPEASRPALQGLQQHFGLIPNLAATMAESPVLVNGFVGALTNFQKGTLTGGQRQIVLLTNAVFVVNWEAVAELLVRRVHREAVGGVPDQATRTLLAEILAYSGVPPSWRSANLGAPLLPVVPVTFRKAERTFHFFSTVTTLGTPQDITVQEIRIECFFPADTATERAARDLAQELR